MRQRGYVIVSSPMSKEKKLRDEVKSLRLQLKQSQAEVTLLRQKLDALAQRMFGKRSEQLNPDQLVMLLTAREEETEAAPEEEDSSEKPVSKRRRSRNGRQAIRTPENLEVVEERIIPECVQADPDKWRQIGQEENKRLDYQPGKFFWVKTVRPKFVRRDQRQLPPAIAPAPLELSLGGKASPGLLAYLLVSRFCDHQPYYRQQRLFARQNEVWISRQQMVEWTAQGTQQLGRIVDVMRDELRQKAYLQTDETPVRYQDRERAGPCPHGWLWVGLDPGHAVVFQWDQSRGSKGLEKLIGKNYRGLLGVDGHSAYRAYAQPRPDVELIGCWAHARRKFMEAKDQSPRVAGWLLNQIAWLFRWEKGRSGQPLSSAVRDRVRASHSRLVIERLGKALRVLLRRYRPKSLMRKAIEYTLNQWRSLTAFLEHSQAELSNNFVENAIRPSALGKKNWLFIGHEKVGQRSAIVYTLTETCRMLGINPLEYIKDVLTRLPATSDQALANLTPANWQKNNAAQLAQAA